MSRWVESWVPLLFISPDHPPHRSDFGKPPDADALPLSRGWAFGLDMHELMPSAAFATHFAPDQFRLNIPEDFPQVTRLIPAFDVAEPALNAHKLPDLVGIAELPFAAAFTSTTSIRHAAK